MLWTLGQDNPTGYKTSCKIKRVIGSNRFSKIQESYQLLLLLLFLHNSLSLRAKDNSKPHCISYGPFPPGLCQSFAMHVPSEYLDGSIIQKHYSTIETSSTQAVEPVVKVGREQSFGSSSVDNNDSSNNQKHASKIANNGEDNKDDSNKNSDKLDAATTSPDPSALIFSVVVSLEMVVPSLSESFEKAALEGMPNPVNSQQTYIMATSVIPSNIVDMKIVKQKINIDGTQYLLHDVFGFKETSNGGEKNSDLDASSRDCVICMCEPRDVIVLPCRHLCVCRDCADVLRNQGKQPQPLTLAEAAPAAESPSTATTANAAEGPDDAATPSTAVNPTSPPITLTTQPPRRTGFNRSLNQLIGSLAETIRQIGVDPILQIPSPTNASGHRPTGPPKCPLCREEFHSLLQIKLPPPPPSDLLRHVVDKADEF